MNVACSDEDRPGAIGSGASFRSPSETCSLGEERRCYEELEQANGVHTCYAGKQSCGAQGWDVCQGGRSFRVAAPHARSGPRGFSLSGAPVECENACDPQCFHWAEPGDLSGTADLAVPDYPGTMGSGPSCAHELCSEGVALDAGCDPCATTVCAADPSCCGAMGGRWDSTCIDVVYNLCLGQERPLSLCDYGLLSASTNQMTITSLVNQSDITIGGLGNITISGGQSVERIVTAGPVYLSSATFPPQGITANGGITLNSSAANTHVGPLESGANVELYTDAIVDGDVFAQGNIVWEGYIFGDAVSGGTVNLKDGCAARVFGGTCTNGSGHAPPSLALPTLPAQTFTCAGTDINVGSSDHTLTPGNYGDVVVGGLLTLDGAGTYNFNRLYAGGLKLQNGGALVTIESCNEFNVLTNAQVLDAGDNLLSDPTQLLVNVKGNLHFDSNVDWVGMVLAGSSGTKSGGSIHGAIWASPVNDINGQDSIVGLDREDCIARGIPGTTPPACPIVSMSAGVPPALRQPCASGLDCQINHRCEAPVTEPSCAHSKCATGAALSAGCDRCVSMICDAEPSCCSANWTSDCVDRVATVCDAVCATDGGDCNAAICTDPADGTSICDFTVSGGGSVHVAATSSVAPRPQVSGSVGAYGALSLNWADVSGDLWVGGALGTASATHGALTAFGPSVFSSRSVTCPATDGAPSSGAIPPGNYGAVVVPAGQTLTLSAGDYTFSSLVLSDEAAGSVARLQLPISGMVRVEVCGAPVSVVLGSDSQILGLTPTTALNFDLYAAGGIVSNGGATSYGFFQSATDISLNDSDHFGFLASGDTLSLFGETNVQGAGLRGECLMGGFDPAQDPIVLGWPSESGSCMPNNVGYQDATCSDFDLALGVPCDDQVPVCNHGTAAYSGSVTVGMYDSLSPAMSDPTPAAPTGTCVGLVNLPAGGCETITCPSIPAGLVTMMLDPADLLDECGGDDRRLDNWTVHDGRACTGTAAYEYDYVATCSENGTSPAWGLLTYSATIPGASTIEFLARVGAGATDAAAAAAAAAQPFVPVLTADHTLENCAPGSPLPCPVDLTASLALGADQGHHLDLRVVLVGAGSASPRLADWDISYSCVFDE